MNHKKIRIIISSYIDREAADSEKHLAEEHLKVCSECRSFVEQAGQIRDNIRAAAGMELNDGFALRVRSAVVQSERQTEEWIGVEHLARNTVFAFAAVVIAMFFFTSSETSSSPGIAEVLIDGTGNDSAAAHVLLDPGDLSKNDILYAVITK